MMLAYNQSLSLTLKTQNFQLNIGLHLNQIVCLTLVNFLYIMNKVNYEYRLSMGRGVSTKNN